MTGIAHWESQQKGDYPRFVARMKRFRVLLQFAKRHRYTRDVPGAALLGRKLGK
jgi:hypothetical protein